MKQRAALLRTFLAGRDVMLLDEPFGALDAKVRAELREWLRRLHEDVHVTTLLVTHDQEEALSIADHIAVMDNARIEQVGGPRELYDRPRNEFVMGFLGPVAEVDGTLVRPHDIAIRTEPAGKEAQVTRVSHLGFEVRVELVLPEGEPVFAQLTRTEAEELDLAAGDIVWLRTAGGTALTA
jgi:sulfate transport system ATP-binding protein